MFSKSSLLSYPLILVASLALVVSCGQRESSPPDDENLATNKNLPGEADQAPLEISQAHMMQMPPGQTRAAVYMSIKNIAKEPQFLVQASTEIAGATEIHNTVYEEGMMKMRRVNHLQFNPGDSTNFEPGGLHFMLLDVAEPPGVGESFNLVLELKNHSITVPVEVRAVH